MCAILKYDFQRRKNTFSEETYLNYAQKEKKNA